jgi:hypothetical protein
LSVYNAIFLDRSLMLLLLLLLLLWVITVRHV